MDVRSVIESTGGVLFIGIPAKIKKEMGIMKGDLLEVTLEKGVLKYKKICQKAFIEKGEGI